MARNDRLKEYLYHRGARSARDAGFATEGGDLYYCPLCEPLRAFPKEALTLEHAPPEALGGRLALLTCSACNHGSGSNFDAHLVRAVDSLGLGRGRAKPHTLKGGVAVAQSAVPAAIRVSAEGIAVFLAPESAAKPGTVAGLGSELDEIVREGRTDWTVRLSFEPYSQRYANIALLRSAYLLAVSFLGYRVCRSQAASVIRRQIGRPDEELFPLRLLGDLVGMSAPAFVRLNEATAGLLIPIVSTSGGVLLPWASSLDEFEYALSGWKTGKFAVQAISIPPSDFRSFGMQGGHRAVNG